MWKPRLSCFNTALNFPKVVCNTFRPLKGPGTLSVYVTSPNEQLGELTGVRTRALSCALSLMHSFLTFSLPLESKAAVIVGRFCNVVVLTKICGRHSNQWKTTEEQAIIYSLFKVVYTIQSITTKYFKNRYKS